MRPTELPWVQDHVVQSNTVYPAAGFLAMAIEAAQQHAAARDVVVKGYNLREFSISRALITPQSAENVETLLSLRPSPTSTQAPSYVWDEFCISSSTDGLLWTENCRGLISVQRHNETTGDEGVFEHRVEREENRHMIAQYEKDCTTDTNATDVYKALDKLGLTFGPLFANMRTLRTSSHRCIADVSIPDTAAVMPARFEYPFIIHPATLDSCIHALFPIDGPHNQHGQGTPLPTYIDEVFVSHDIEKSPNYVLTVYANSVDKDIGREASVGYGERVHSLAVFDRQRDERQPSIVVKGLILTSLARNSSDIERSSAEKLYYQISWLPNPSFLTSSQVSELGRTSRQPFEEGSQFRKVQQAAFYYAKRALDNVSASESSSLQPHLRRFYTALSGFCNAVHKGRFGQIDTDDWLDDDSESRTLLCAQVSQMAYGKLLCHIGENLSQILRNKIDPLSLMMEHDHLERYYRTNPSMLQCYQQAAAYIRLLGNKNPHLNILEIGAGTGGASVPILEALSGTEGKPPYFARYHFTDLSPAFFPKAAEKLERWSDQVVFQMLDVETDPLQQGYEPGSFDLVVAANALHATTRVGHTLERVRRLLKPGGKLVIIELTVDTIAASLIFGTLPGWWIGRCTHSRDSGRETNTDQGRRMVGKVDLC